MSFHNFASRKAIGALDKKFASQDIFIARIVNFIYNSLQKWKDDVHRPQANAEKKLNASLCKSLNAQADITFKLIRFTNEDPQDNNRQPDMSIGPAGTGIAISGYNYSIYDILFSIECKRLPTAPPKSREREYVWGPIDRSATGGIQRFKTGDHSSALNHVALIAYIQKGEILDWHAKIGLWIQNFIDNNTTDCRWSENDKLVMKHHEPERAYCLSTNCRKRSLPPITIHHLWIKM